MFLGYCLDPVSHTWFPPVPLTTPEECWRFCLRYHTLTPEIRIADFDDFLVLHVIDQVLRMPLEGGLMRLIDLRDGLTNIVPIATVETPVPLSDDPDGLCEICERQPWTQLAKWHQCLVCHDCAANEPWPEGA